ncbi:flagellar export protein FliJ [Phenylobacterium montanum]|uniref:Flagellar FliJ protein n=1 Tax=Phenylobacterium montanum TaxID=2823693 RepID=A0A975IWP1_9CAUL|nr:flagellar FliJ family protein [Caulobacter sp. S6]QUD90045.1 flagellar FliJ family protein [Caulobacter sp. S6]
MSWRESLIRISNHEVETLQKRLGEVVHRKSLAEMKLSVLEAEIESEKEQAQMGGLDVFWSLQGFLEGAKHRRVDIETQIRVIAEEEAGARDALNEAFERLKKFEHVAEMARLSAAKELAKRETAALDEMGLRAAAR